MTAETTKVISRGNRHCFLMCWHLPVTIATYILTSSPMKQRFRSSPAHSCTPTMPKMKKTKKHSASTLPSIGSVSKRRVTRIRIPTNKHGRGGAKNLVLHNKHEIKACMQLLVIRLQPGQRVLHCEVAQLTEFRHWQLPSTQICLRA